MCVSVKGLHTIPVRRFLNEYLIQITSCVSAVFDESLIDTLESLAGSRGLQMSPNLQRLRCNRLSATWSSPRLEPLRAASLTYSSLMKQRERKLACML